MRIFVKVFLLTAIAVFYLAATSQAGVPLITSSNVPNGTLSGTDAALNGGITIQNIGGTQSPKWPTQTWILCVDFTYFDAYMNPLPGYTNGADELTFGILPNPIQAYSSGCTDQIVDPDSPYGWVYCRMDFMVCNYAPGYLNVLYTYPDYRLIDNTGATLH